MSWDDKGDKGGIKDEETERPPDDPPKVIYHGHYGTGQEIPEEYRRVFGTPLPKDAKRPIPPPPLPPGSYHKKPKYWQLRHTSHAQVPNRVAGVVSVVLIGVAYLIHKFSDAPTRWDNRIGWRMSPQEKIDYDQKNELFHQMLAHVVPPEQFATDVHGEKYINIRRSDAKLRWDIREVDQRIVWTREMSNPMDDPL